jgi:uncharacterized protein (TIGR03000 family)
MLPQSSPLLRSAVLTAAVLVLGLSVARSARAQAPVTPGAPGGYREPGPVTPEIYEAGGGQQRTSTGQSSSNPVLTPGYFEVVCPAICYGGAFHVCGVRAFGGPGYYGPFRRYWGYSTYGPNFNIGPDNSLQYGLQSGVMYVATRSCQGLYKHGGDCACGKCPLCAKGGSAAAAYGPIGQMSFLTGASQQPPGNLPQPTPNAAGQQPEKVPPPTGKAAYLRLLVPENAEVLVEGRKTTTTGTTREFVSPPLEPGKNMIYSIVVRYTDAGGKPMEETHSIRIHANDRLDINCTKPAQAEPPRATAQRP